jgi:hypothetical protein
LAVGLAGFAALRFETKLLVVNVPAVRLEQLFAMEAFTLLGLGHRQSEGTTNREVNGRSNATMRRRNKTEPEQGKKSFQ